jgi:hypothetical protein
MQAGQKDSEAGEILVLIRDRRSRIRMNMNTVSNAAILLG